MENQLTPVYRTYLNSHIEINEENTEPVGYHSAYEKQQESQRDGYNPPVKKLLELRSGKHEG